ncbi:hypothetical protein KFL_007690015 [Klebsormidium nitens]|uniref:Uncharacterized protein n=1 Tax=Klebsormidium nitens TaxID=105231 RepID=A0A1Y1IPB6_KLENI|nr:hypothetical protein KFL_007690015 [Klebsormidium nitens]|eukprot:GAQ91339.1 hypothetical protein KFL_007690015 [Klebsormidium nitens]
MSAFITHVGDQGLLDKTLSSTHVHQDRNKIEDLARHIWQLHLDGHLPNDKFEVVPHRKPPPAADENLIHTFRLQGPDEDVYRKIAKDYGSFLRHLKFVV